MASETKLSVGDGRFEVRVWSEGSGEPLLYLHGLEGHPGDAPFLHGMARGRRVVAPEHPGFGDSTGIDAVDDIVDMVLFYRELVETLGLGQVDLVGHSLGGMFAGELAALCPTVVRRLVLVAPFGLWLEEAEIPDLFVMSPNQLQRATWHDPESAAARQAAVQTVDGAPAIPAIVGRAMNLSAAGKFLWPIPDRGLAKRLRYIKAPTLVVMGASDKLIPPAYGEAFVSRIPNARLATIPDAGHTPMLEQPDAFFTVLDEFLAG